MEQLKANSDDWSEAFNITVHDADGWRGKSWEEEIGVDEFLKRFAISTISGMNQMRSADEAVQYLKNKIGYQPMDHADWEPGDLIVNVRTGNYAFVSRRKVDEEANPFEGWWVVDAHGRPGGGVGDFVKDWRSIKCLLAERRHYGL